MEAMGQEVSLIKDYYELQMTNENLRGEGSFGKVYIGSSLQTKLPVAIKVITKNGMCPEDNEFILNEVGI